MATNEEKQGPPVLPDDLDKQQPFNPCGHPRLRGGACLDAPGCPQEIADAPTLAAFDALGVQLEATVIRDRPQWIARDDGAPVFELLAAALGRLEFSASVLAQLAFNKRTREELGQAGFDDLKTVIAQLGLRVVDLRALIRKGSVHV